MEKEPKRQWHEIAERERKTTKEITEFLDSPYKMT